MSVDNEGLIVVSKISGSRHLNLHHLESLLCCGPTDIYIMVDAVNIQHNEFREAVSTAEGAELILPIGLLINFVGTHSKDVHHLHEGGYFVDQHQWAKSTQLL